MLKVCPHCKAEFETAYKSIRYCTNMCRDDAKAKQYMERWAAGKPKTNNGGQAFRLFSLSKRDVDTI